MEKANKISHLGIVQGSPRNEENTRVFIDGSTRSYTALRTAAIGLGTYQPGWRWSLHAGPQIGKDSENHIGYIISGRMMVRDTSGNQAEVEAGCVFEIEAGSDAWVIGDEPCVALDFIPFNDPSTSQE